LGEQQADGKIAPKRLMQQVNNWNLLQI
jgi:hypothetical protein